MLCKHCKNATKCLTETAAAVERWCVGQAVTHKLPSSRRLCVGKGTASASVIKCMPSPFINKNINTGHVVTDLEMQDVVCRDVKAGCSSVVYF